MQSNTREVFDDYITESKYLWNSSGLDDDLIYCANEALDKFSRESMQKIDFERCPDAIARKMGMKLVHKTVQMILALYEVDQEY